MLIKAVEVRTMDTGIAPYNTLADATCADFAQVEHDRGVVQAKMEQVRQTRLHHEEMQGFVLMKRYFTQQLALWRERPRKLERHDWGIGLHRRRGPDEQHRRGSLHSISRRIRTC